MTTLATSSGAPRRWTGTLAAIANPGSVALRSSRSSLLSQVLKLRLSAAVRICRDGGSYVDLGVAIMPVAPIIAGKT